MRRIGVVQPDPLHSGNVRHLLNELSDMLLAVNIDTIVGQFLSNHIKLLATSLYQIAHLIQNLCHRPTLVASSNQGNRTVGTMTITAFTDLYVGIVIRGCHMTMINIISHRLLTDVLQELTIVKLPVPAIHLWNFFLKISQITF